MGDEGGACEGWSQAVDAVVEVCDRAAELPPNAAVDKVRQAVDHARNVLRADDEALGARSEQLDGYLLLADAGLICGAPKAEVVVDRAETAGSRLAEAMSLRFDALNKPDDGFCKDERIGWQHACTATACTLLAADRRDAVVKLLADMWSCRVPLLSSQRKYTGPACTKPLLNTIHLYLKKKRWPDTVSDPTEALPPSQRTEARAFCSFCDAGFKSRNALFRHLRSVCPKAPAELSVDPMVTQAPATTPPPVTVRSGSKARRLDTHQSRARPPPPPPLVSPVAGKVWLGDIPGRLCTSAKVRELLYQVMPPHFPKPHVEKVVRKGYRSKAPDGTKQPWLGYAFICFRDHAEAAEAITLLDGKDASDDYVLRLRWAERATGDPVDATQSVQTTAPRAASLAPGADPPLKDQLFPRNISAAKRKRSLSQYCTGAGLPSTAGLTELLEHFTANPRNERRVEGIAVAPTRSAELLQILESLRWPAARSRPGVRAEHYLLLYHKRPNPGFEELASAAAGLLTEHFPEYPCTMIAVTKNFEGSPHTDDRDCTHQIAISLGDFGPGGELCVESDVFGEVFVVNTHDRIAEVDGRFTHWVRGWGGGDRYSLIFFCTSEAAATKPTFAVRHNR